MFLLKLQKLARHGGLHLLSQLLGRLRYKNHLNPGPEVAVSQDCATTLQPGRQRDLVSKKKKKKHQTAVAEMLFYINHYILNQDYQKWEKYNFCP